MKKNVLKLLSIFITVLMVFGMVNLPSKAVAQTSDQSLEKVENKVLDALSTEGASNYVIEMAEKADLSKAYSITDWSERGWYVYNTLREVAARTQKPIIEILEKQGVKYQSFFAANEIAVFGSGLSTLTEISSLKAVDHIRFPRTATIDPGFLSIQPSTVSQASINALDWGITDTNADDFWSTFGLQGDGLIVANIDTGVQWDHPALDQSFKCGTNPTDPACWADPANVCGGSACDNNGHGTHTMGTMVGDDDPSLTYQVGMAPNAQWIACKGCESTDCSDASLNACADWILAPNGNPTNRPHIVNNSWGGGGGEDWYLSQVQAWRDAGIFPVFSAGNSGPACGSIGSPGDYQQSFASASHMSTRTISDFSSRGPSAVFGDDPYTKPNISAPGSNITSSVPGNGYASISGTSMAAPHVAGAVALLWSCNASLIGDMTATFKLLQDTADPPNDAGNCGVPTDGEGNFTYGYGYLNVLAAGQQVCAAGMIDGTVTDGTSPVEGATVTADDGAGLILDTLTLADGTYTLNAPDGTYGVSATKYGYTEDVELGIVVVDGATVTVDFVITPLASTLVSGYVYDGGVEGLGSHGYPLYSSIRVSTPGFDETIFTDPFTGYYEIELVEDTPHTFTTQPIPGGYDSLFEVVTATGIEYTHDIYVPVNGAVCAAPGYQPDYDFFYSFEGSDEGFTSGGTASSWAWGDFTSGPMAGHSGTKGIATNPAGNYNNEEDGWMVSPAIDLTGYGTAIPMIQWWDWMYLESATYDYDYGSLEVTKDGGLSWLTVWGPDIRQDMAYSQQSVVLDPTYNVANFQFRFFFHSDFSVVEPGWYVDDIGITSTQTPPSTTVFSTDFDTDNGGFVASGANSTWAWGASSTGPGAAYSPPNVWATNLAGNYNNYEESYITSPVLDLSAYAGLAPTINWLDWLNIESLLYDWDWAQLDVTKDGGTTWEMVWKQKRQDVSGYTMQSVALDPTYAVSNFQFRFHFESDISGVFPGWYIDDVAVTVAEPAQNTAPCMLIPGGVVAGYVYDANDFSPIVDADVYSDVVETQTFFIPEDPASEGLYWVFHPVMGPPPINIQSLGGSNITFDPTIGGDAAFIPGVPGTLCFESNVYSIGWEWMLATWLKFPSDWTITDAYLSGTPACDLGFWEEDFVWYFETEPYEITIEHIAEASSAGDHCVAEYCVEVTPGTSAGLASWYYLGDVYGDLPHYPCSSDVYTPASMAVYPCDESVNPQASIPMSGGEAHDFTAEKELYGSDTHTVSVYENTIVQQDFYLGTGELSFAPSSFEVTMMMGDPAITETLMITNIGSAGTDYAIAEIDKGYTPPAPLATVERVHVADINSIHLSESGLSGSGLAEAPASAFLNADVELILDDGSVENNIGIGGTSEMLWLNRFTPNPAAFPFTLNEIQVYFETAGLVNIGDDMTLVVYENTSGNTDPAIGANFLAQFPVTVQALDAWNTFTLPTGVFFAGPGDVLIGVIGLELPGTDYWPAAFDQTATQARSWAGWWSASPPPVIPILPPDAAWILIDAYFPGNWMVRGMGSAGSGDVIWLSESPVSGTIPGGGFQDVTLTINPASLTQPGDYLAHLLVTHDTPYTYPQIPVLLHLLSPADYGELNGTVTGLETCDINPTALEGATVNIWQTGSILYSTTTLANGYYYLAIPAGTYDIEVTAAGFVSQTVSGVVLASGATVTNDFELRNFAPCLSLNPTSLEATQQTDQLTQKTLQVCNTGAGPMTWELVEAENPLTVLQTPEQTFEPVLKDYPLHYLSDGSIDCSYYANYTGFEPAEVAQSCGSPQTTLQVSVPTGPTDIGYALDIGYVSDNFVSFPLNNFTGQTVIGANATAFYGMDFDASGTVLYALNDVTGQLGTIDLATGAFTGLVACPPGGGASNWTGLSIDPTTDEFFGSTATDLYTINPSTGVSTLVGPFGTTLMIDIAINMDGDIYGHDIGTDSIYSIDKSTGAATLIGPTGYLANYAQGMDFDNDDGTLYIFLYQGSGANVYGTVNLSTGAVAPLAVSAPEGEFEGAIPIAGTPFDIPWASEDPLSGTLDGDSCTNVTVTFDSTGLALGDYSGYLRIMNPPANPGEVSLILHVTGAIPLTITADPATKVYGDPDPVFTYTASDPSVPLTGALSREPGENVGTYAITLGTLDAGDEYAITFVPADFTISARPITITADPATKVYGDPDPVFTYIASDPSVPLTGSLSREPGEDVGTYAITLGSLDAGNQYAITFVPANFTITARPITITADPATKVYGDPDPVFTYTASDPSVPLTGSLSREPGENVGTYAITLGTLDAGEQYTITFVPANFTISARPIAITADDKGKIEGDPDPELTYQVTSGSLAGDDEIIGELARDPGEDAGTYEILIGTLEIVDGNNGDNYYLTFVNGTFTIEQGITYLYLPLILK